MFIPDAIVNDLDIFKSLYSSYLLLMFCVYDSWFTLPQTTNFSSLTLHEEIIEHTSEFCVLLWPSFYYIFNHVCMLVHNSLRYMSDSIVFVEQLGYIRHATFTRKLRLIWWFLRSVLETYFILGCRGMTFL